MGMTLSEMQELEAMWTYEKSNEKVLKLLLELLGNHLKRLDDRIADLDILRHEITEYQERIQAKIAKKIMLHRAIKMFFSGNNQ